MIEQRTYDAPELRGIHWLNSAPLSIHTLRGSVIALFFWDHTCIRSLRMLEYVKELHSRYHDTGLVVIGVHSPAFEFAGKGELLEEILYEHNIEFPILMDNDRATFEMYRNNEIPAIVIVDQGGYIRSQYHGRGKQQTIERDIQVHLQNSGILDTLPLPIDALRPEEQPGVVCERETPQIYFGYLKGTIGNKEGYNPESELPYEDPGVYVPGKYYLSGVWRSNRHSMVLEQLISDNGYIVTKYEGQEVFALIGNEGDGTIHLQVTQDGKNLTPENMGYDIRFDRSRKSFIEVSKPRLIHLVANKESAEHILKISSQSSGVEIFSLTFMPGVVPELFGRN